jgi:hypothetical protein
MLARTANTQQTKRRRDGIENPPTDWVQKVIS